MIRNTHIHKKYIQHFGSATSQKVAMMNKETMERKHKVGFYENMQEICNWLCTVFNGRLWCYQCVERELLNCLDT
jgi:hypothetical protein